MITNLTAHTVKVTKKEAKTASVALTRRGAAKAYATLDGSEASASVNENMRVTRGQQNRKPTDKYAEFQKDKTSPAKAAKAPVAPEATCTAAAKRQAKRDEKKAEACQSEDEEQGPGGPLGETANSSPDKAAAQLGHDLNLILQKSSDRLSKSKQQAQNAALKLTS